MINDDVTVTKPKSIFEGLSFDVNAPVPAVNGTSKRAADLPDDEESAAPKKKKRRTDPVVDRTGDLDTRGPQSADDFERLLLSSPDRSILWIQYMAYHTQHKSFDLARAVGEQALKSIGISQDAEKFNIWIALLNLEINEGDADGTSSARSSQEHWNFTMHRNSTNISPAATSHSRSTRKRMTCSKK